MTENVWCFQAITEDAYGVCMDALSGKFHFQACTAVNASDGIYNLFELWGRWAQCAAGS